MRHWDLTPAVPHWVIQDAGLGMTLTQYLLLLQPVDTNLKVKGHEGSYVNGPTDIETIKAAIAKMENRVARTESGMATRKDLQMGQHATDSATKSTCNLLPPVGCHCDSVTSIKASPVACKCAKCVLFSYSFTLCMRGTIK